MTWADWHLDELGRCCGKKPRPYKRKGWMLCLRCDKAYDLTFGHQIENFAWIKITDGVFTDRMKTDDARDVRLIKVDAR